MSSRESNKNLKLILGVASTIAVGGLAYFILKKRKQAQQQDSQDQLNESKINREKLAKNEEGNIILAKLSSETQKQIYIEFLRDQLRHFHPIIDELEQVTRYLREQAKAKGQDPRPDEIYMTVMENKGIQLRLSQKEQEVYTKHLIDKEELGQIVKEKFKEDPECKRLLDKTATLISAACSGVNLCDITPVPEILTAQKSFEITQKCMMISNVQLQKELMNIFIKKGKLDLEDPENRNILNQIDITEQREKVFKEEKIFNLEDPATRVLRAAVNKYLNENPETYAAKLKELEQIHQNCYKSLLEDPMKVKDFKTIYNLKYVQ